MKNLTKTLVFTIVLCLIVISLTIFTQLSGQETVGDRCSYLDPIIIDLLAFLLAVFLVVEGFIRIFEHPNSSLKRQLTRPIRIAIGCSIITVHIIQFIHK